MTPAVTPHKDRALLPVRGMQVMLAAHAGRRVAELSDRLEEPIPQVREPQGLRERRGKAGLGVLVGEGRSGGREQDEHGGLGAAHGTNLPGERDAVHLGHLVVEQGDVEGIALSDPAQSDGR